MDNQSEAPVNLALLLAWILAFFAFAFTLYGSQILHYPVCVLCWYQRICLYPLVVILGLAAFNNDNSVVAYVLPLPIIGAVFATYHYLEQSFPSLINFIPLCSKSVPCSAKHMQLLGFITYPLLSLIACITLATLLFLARRKNY